MSSRLTEAEVRTEFGDRTEKFLTIKYFGSPPIIISEHITNIECMYPHNNTVV